MMVDGAADFNNLKSQSSMFMSSTFVQLGSFFFFFLESE